MIFQPAIIALLLAAGLSLAMLATASPFAVQLIRHWDLGSGSERQLRLERLTYLFSMMVALVCGLQVLSTLLFVFNADKMSVMFVGAMCAVGTLNANDYGFPALYAQLVAVLLRLHLAGDQPPRQPGARLSAHPPQVPPAARLRAARRAGAVPAVQLLHPPRGRRHHLVLRQPVLGRGRHGGERGQRDGAGARRSRCSTPRLGGAVAARRCWHWRERRAAGVERARGGRVAAVAAFFAALDGIVAFVSLYIYEHPNHHCPFCILKPEYDYQGYLLYIPLFAAAAAGTGGRGADPVRAPAQPRHAGAAGERAPGRHRRGGLRALPRGGELHGALLQPDPARVIPAARETLLLALACALLAACGTPDTGPTMGSCGAALRGDGPRRQPAPLPRGLRRQAGDPRLLGRLVPLLRQQHDADRPPEREHAASGLVRAGGQRRPGPRHRRRLRRPARRGLSGAARPRLEDHPPVRRARACRSPTSSIARAASAERSWARQIRNC